MDSRYHLTPIAQRDFTGNLMKLLAETFEGPPGTGGNAFLDKGAGLFQTVDALTADTASRPPSPGAPTIAAHCAHIAYYVRVLHSFILGREQTIDWPSSWQVQQVTEPEWHALRGDMRHAYDDLVASLSSILEWGDDPVGDSMAVVVHTAYHLGAIRQILRSVSP